MYDVGKRTRVKGGGRDVRLLLLDGGTSCHVMFASNPLRQNHYQYA
jgi:hypothetical protein